MFGICNLSIVPCRKEPSDKSEMVTQLLFGEHFELLDTKGNWQLIRIAYDGYECWIDKKQFHPVSDIKGISDYTTAITTEIVQWSSPQSSLPHPPFGHFLQKEKGNGKSFWEGEEQHIPIVLGSSLPKFKDKSFFLGKLKYSFEGEAIFPFAKHKKKSSFGGVEEVSRWYLNTPYLWGGRSPFGIDCSGFTQMVYKLNGIKLQRDACQQAEQGKALSFLEEAKAGDLAFFDNEDGKIVHVGIITTSQPSPKEKESYAQSSPPLGEPKVGIQARREGLNFNIIHASGKVRIDKLDHQGIYNEEMKKYTHRLRVAKKY